MRNVLQCSRKVFSPLPLPVLILVRSYTVASLHILQTYQEVRLCHIYLFTRFPRLWLPYGLYTLGLLAWGFARLNALTVPNPVTAAYL